MKKSTGIYLPKEGFVDVNIHANAHMYIDRVCKICMHLLNMEVFAKTELPRSC